MAVWAIADLHLSFGVPDKDMNVFGENWVNYTNKLIESWHDLIKEDDLVLIAGDISWAMKTENAKPDLDWIHQRPGTKVMIRGNHDYWWGSLSKVEKILPSSIHVVQNNAFNWKEFTIGGTRLWDTPEYNFNDYIVYKENTRAKKLTQTDSNLAEAEKIFERELARLELSLQAMSKDAETKIVMTHYPPISAQLQPSRTSALLEKYQTDICVFGHLHNVKQEMPMFGKKNGVSYYLTSCDYLNFVPVKVVD